jgi:hypothetical protein
MLIREQVESYLTGLVQDKVDGVRVAQLLDTDAALRAALASTTAIVDRLKRLEGM